MKPDGICRRSFPAPVHAKRPVVFQSCAFTARNSIPFVPQAWAAELPSVTRRAGVRRARARPGELALIRSPGLRGVTAEAITWQITRADAARR